MKYLLTYILTLSVFSSIAQPKKNWTILYYAAGSNSSEVDLLSDVEEMKRGKQSDEYNLILLIDRIEGHSEDSTTLGENFTDTRLYEIGHETSNQLSGKNYFPEIGPGKSYDANMGDAHTLKKFIQYGKLYYPAKHYMLVLRSHGNGVSMCADAEVEENDRLYPAELTAILSKNESVDIFGLDVCSMAGLENLYQWRPENPNFSADIVIASSPLSGAWAYDKILERITSKPDESLALDDNFFEGGQETTIDPQTMTPIDFSKLIFEEIYDQQRWASWGLFDNTKISPLKRAIDDAAELLAMEDKALVFDIIQRTLGYYHNTSNDMEISQLTFPYIDAYHFWKQIADEEAMSAPVREISNTVCKLIDVLTIHSYYGRGFLPETNHFEEGKSGVYQIIPQGNQIFSQSNRSFWSHCGWYHPDDKSSEQASFGLYDWCLDGATRGNHQVDNFFEFLDYLFDDANDEVGGVNNYQW